MADLSLLQIDLHTLFEVTDSGRMIRVNDPDHSTGPRLFFAGCPEGNLVSVRSDVDDRLARRLAEIAAAEPPWRDPWVLPNCIGKLLDAISNLQPSATGRAASIPLTVSAGLIYSLPGQMKFEHPATIVRGDTAQGVEMAEHFVRNGMPTQMREAGFNSAADLWEPWCLAIENNEVASAAFAARLASDGAEIGVYTFPGFRGRGFAAAVTASWSSMPSLNGRALFYSTSRSNRSSQAVAARLGLRMIGASVGIG